MIDGRKFEPIPSMNRGLVKKIEYNRRKYYWCPQNAKYFYSIALSIFDFLLLLPI